MTMEIKTKLSFKGGLKMAAFSKVEKVLITSYFNQTRNYIRRKNQICGFSF